jgi:PcRGLX-like protein central beta sandwich domain/Beta-L-arabinofuranosidase, GH127 catalytic domain/PcRGLX-like N-terminal RIFT barrel domain
MKKLTVILALMVLSLSLGSPLMAVYLTVQERSGIQRINEPVTTGVPLPVGWALSVDELVLSLNGEPLPTEFRPVDYWPDGSLRWVHMDFQVSVDADGSLGLSLDKGAASQIESKLEVNIQTKKITVTTGKIKAEVLGPGFNVFDNLWLAGADSSYGSQLLSPHTKGLLLMADGTEYRGSNDTEAEIEVESQGPMRIVLKVEGDFKSAAGAAIDFHYICRLYFYNNSPVVRLAYTFENRGYYQEGREDKVSVEGLHVELPVESGDFTYLAGYPHGVESGALPAGGENYLYVSNSGEFNHVIDGSETVVGNPKSEKPDYIGWIGLQNSGGATGNGILGVGLRHFWQMYPSSLELAADGGLLTVGMIPYRLNQPIDIYSGVARTHYLRFAFLEPEDADKLGPMLAACQKPLLAVASPEYYCRESKAFGKILERNEALYPPEHLKEVRRVEQEFDYGLEDMLKKVDSRTKNDVTAEGYGMLNWGDGMHYAWQSGVHQAKNIAWNHHYYDLPFISCLEYARTGDYRWLDYFLSRSYHLMDVHVTHLEPGQRLDGANRYCPPTDHVRNDPTDDSDYTTARVYISPYTNHHKTQGLFSAYYFTGDERTLEVALKAADFANSFGGYSDWKQPRGAAFQVLTLIAAYQASGDDDYLNTAQETFKMHWDYFAATSNKFFQGYFMVGFMLEAFIDYYETTRDERVIDWVQQAVDFMVAQKPDEIYSNMALGIGFLAAELEDPDYIELQKVYLAKWQGRWSNAFKDFGLHGRGVARSLYYLSYEGLGLEPPLRGDFNGDEKLSVTDVFALILKGFDDPADPEIDWNKDGKYTIVDAISLLIYIVTG